MSYGDIDEEFKRIIEKADRIVTHEVIQQERFDTLIKLREEDGRIKIKITQIREEYNDLEKKIMEAKDLLSTHEQYFEIIGKYSGEKQQEILKESFGDYSWAKYSKIQDELYALTKDKSIKDMESELNELEKKIEELTERRGNLVENSLLILADIDKTLKKYER